MLHAKVQNGGQNGKKEQLQLRTIQIVFGTDRVILKHLINNINTFPYAFYRKGYT